jgi:hypothetical protein
MITKLKKIFHQHPEKKDFSSFFNNASPAEHKALMEDVARKANKDQRDLVERYEQAHQKTA